MSTISRLTVRAIRNFEELETVRAYWEGWQNHPNSDFDHFKLVCQLRSEVECPYVTVIEQDGQPVALLAGRLERTHFAPAVGYLKPVRISAKVMTVINQGSLGKLDEETATELVNYLWSLLCSGIADAIEFNHLPEHSLVLKVLREYRSRWFCEKNPSWSMHWQMAIPEGMDFFQHKTGSKQRWKIRKRQRELESAFPGKVSWQWTSRFDNVREICARIEEVAALTYQRGLGAGFVDNEEHRQRFSLFASRNQLRVQLLEIDGRVRAFWIGTVYKGVFHSSETGYDPELHMYEVGTQVFIQMVNELVREGVQKLDFGLGDGVYKQRYGDRSWRETTVRIFAPTMKGIFLRFSLGTCAMLDKVCHRLLENVGVINQLKTSWRRRLAPAKPEADGK
jgi:CelD/BcsL family acetyltransferase involved in cellulose biosynthesis